MQYEFKRISDIDLLAADGGRGFVDSPDLFITSTQVEDAVARALTEGWRSLGLTNNALFMYRELAS